MASSLVASELQMAALDRALVQFRQTVLGRSRQDVHAVAASGARGGGAALPHLATIQRAFGRHDVSSVRAYRGPDARAATEQLGARAYASGDQVVLGPAGEDLHTVAHEAAHVIQQRGGVALAGGVGAVGDVYERHADAVADAVVAGRSAEGLLDRSPGSGTTAGTQLRAVQLDPLDPDRVRAADRQSGPQQGSIGLSEPEAESGERQQIQAYLFPGRTNERVLILGAVHGNERGGTEVAADLLDMLNTMTQQGRQPRCTVIIVPVLCPVNVERRHRNTDQGTAGARNPNRNLPEAGQGYAAEENLPEGRANPQTDAQERPILSENQALMALVDRFGPSRIVSIHGTVNPNRAGFFHEEHDGPTSQSTEDVDEDRRVTSAMAADMRGRGHRESVRGNRRGRTSWSGNAGEEETASNPAEEGSTLGNWAAHATTDGVRNREAMSVITVEVNGNPNSQDAGREARRNATRAGATPDQARVAGNTARRRRRAELRDVAQVIMDHIVDQHG